MAYNKDLRRAIQAARLQKLMTSRKLTSTDLVKGTGIARSTILRYVYGVHVPRNENAEKLAEFLHVSIDWLTGGEEEDKFNVLAANFTELNDAGKKKLIDFSEFLLEEYRRSVS